MVRAYGLRFRLMRAFPSIVCFAFTSVNVWGMTNRVEVAVRTAVSDRKKGNVVAQPTGFRYEAKEDGLHRFAVSFDFPKWEDDTYVFLPGAAYDGNRMCRRTHQRGYPPAYDANGIGRQASAVMWNPPALERDFSGGIEVTAGDLSVPCFGLYFPKAERGFLVFTDQQFGGVNVGFSVVRGMVGVSCPANRAKVYRFDSDAYLKGNDAPVRLKAGEKAVFRCRTLDFACTNVAMFLETFSRNRKCLLGVARPKSKSTPQLRDAVARHLVKDEWKDGRYGLANGRFWTPGFTGGMHTARALFLVGDEEQRRQGASCVDYLVSRQTAAGFFDSDRLDNAVCPVEDRRILLTRQSAEGLFRLLEFVADGDAKESWKQAARRACDAFVALWRRDGDIGQYLDVDSGEAFVGGTTNGAILPAALARAGVTFGEKTYLDVACEIAERYCVRFLSRGYTCGGPSDVLSAPDSESAFALLESLVTLAELDKRDVWLQRAKEAAHLASTWVVAYPYAFPAGSEFRRLDVDATGSVMASVQNKHAAPGICTGSGLALLRLYRMTKESLYLDLCRDIAAFVPQVVSTAERPVLAVKDGRRVALQAGWINERVNLSDWEGASMVGEVFYGPCWCEKAFLLSCGELLSQPEMRDLRTW